MNRSRISKIVCVVAAMAMLTGAGIETYGRVNRPRIRDFHTRVRNQYEQDIRAAIADLGPNGEWKGRENRVAPEAIALLKPNVIFQRQYISEARRKSFSLLLTQTRDARDMLGHYPPVCYAGQGWSEQMSLNRTHVWRVGDLVINGKEYAFRRDYEFSVEEDQANFLVVRNFLMLPDDQTVWDMRKVNKYQEDYRKRGYGAAQVQIVFYGDDTSPEFRDEVTTMVIEALSPMIKTILDGV